MTLELNKIYNECCLGDKELGIGMWRIPDKSVNLILCDLPYGTTEIQWDKHIPQDMLWNHYNRIIKDNGVIVLFAQQPFTSLLGASNIKMLKHSLVWHKDKCGNFLASKYQPRKTHEDILIFSKGSFVHNAKIKATYNPQMKKREKEYKDNRIELKRTDAILALRPNRKDTNLKRDKNYDGTVKYPESVIYFPLEQKDRLHPTQKPIALLEYLIKTYSNEGDVVLDSCMGSGSTAIASINTSRSFIGFELSEEYYKVATNRIELHKKDID